MTNTATLNTSSKNTNMRERERKGGGGDHGRMSREWGDFSSSRSVKFLCCRVNVTGAANAGCAVSVWQMLAQV